MANEEDVKGPYKIKLKDFNGDVVYEMTLKAPLSFPYLFWDSRLFVTSRDEQGTLLERSYHVFMDAAKSNERH